MLLPTWVVSKTHFVVSVDWRLWFILLLDKLCNPFSRCSCHLESWMFGIKSYTLCVCACHNTLPHQRVYYSLCMHGILSDFLREIRSASVCPAPRSLVWQLPLCSSMLCWPIIRVAWHRIARPHCSHFVCMRWHLFGLLASDHVCSIMFSSALLLFLFAVEAVRYPGLFLSQHTRGVS